jgi:hypothetical protein
MTNEIEMYLMLLDIRRVFAELLHKENPDKDLDAWLISYRFYPKLAALEKTLQGKYGHDKVEELTYSTVFPQLTENN